jgi:phosphoglycerate dehydrogenase-like enzyme
VDAPGKQKPEFVEQLGTVQELTGFLGQADFVVLCLPYTKDTHHFINQNRLIAMQPHAVLLNIGRGGVVDEQALIKALKEKKIGGAGLDVTEQEPLPKDSPLWDMENVVITPHHSGISEKYIGRAIDLFCLNLQAYLKGERLPNLIDKTVGY